jgi:hypothetical protein
MITAFFGSNHMARKIFKKTDSRLYSHILMSASFIAILLSGLGYLGQDIWLASTQWLLVSAVLGAFGTYFRIDS